MIKVFISALVSIYILFLTTIFLLTGDIQLILASLQSFAIGVIVGSVTGIIMGLTLSKR